MERHTQFTVKGKPFFPIGGQVHNSSGYAVGKSGEASYEEDAKRAFQSLHAIGANTAAIPVCWDAFEPMEGVYETTLVKRMIDRCRKEELHLIILWFATWKNGQMEYTPVWVKKDRERFPRCRLVTGEETAVLSPFYEENRRVDERAFCALLSFLKEYDEDTGTVIAVQVENEPGMYAGSIRDFSEKGNAAFLSDVPKEVIDAAIRAKQEEPSSAFALSYKENGSRKSGTWREVFGNFGAELCMSYATASYINRIAGAGKKIYDIFLYVNVWMDRCGERGWSLAGLDYPSGGAVSKVLPLWDTLLTNVDAICPDNYEGEPAIYQRSCEMYDRTARAFYVPESGFSYLNAALMMEAVGDHKAIGYHVFGIESALDAEGNLRGTAEGIARSFFMLSSVRPLLESKTKAISLVQLPGQDSLRLCIDSWICRVSFAGVSPDFCGWVATDCRHKTSRPDAHHVVTDLSQEMARGLLFYMGEGEFYLVGENVRLYFMNKSACVQGSIPSNLMSAQHLAHNTEYFALEEGHFEDGRFVVDRLRSGDEGRHGVWAYADCGVVHFVLGKI